MSQLPWISGNGGNCDVTVDDPPKIAGRYTTRFFHVNLKKMTDCDINLRKSFFILEEFKDDIPVHERKAVEELFGHEKINIALFKRIFLVLHD